MIGLLGLNHKSAPIEVRERFVFCEEDIRRFVTTLRGKAFLEQSYCPPATGQRSIMKPKTTIRQQTLRF